MSELNPYAATDVVLDVADECNENPLYQMERKALNKLYYRSCNVSSLVGLWTLGLSIVVFVLFSTSTGEKDVFTIIYGAMSVLYLATIIGCFKRTPWGRVLGIIVCCFMLLSIPIGTILGIMGLVAFLKAPELFGDDRITHKELKAVFKDRKKRKV